MRQFFVAGATATALLVCSTQILLAQSASTQNGVAVAQEPKAGGAAAAPGAFALVWHRLVVSMSDPRPRDDGKTTQVAGTDTSQPMAQQQ